MRQVRFARVMAAVCVGAAALCGCGKSGTVHVDDATPAPQKPEVVAKPAPQVNPAPVAPAAPVQAPPRASPRPAEERVPPGRISLTAGLRKAMETAENTPVPAWVPLYPDAAKPARVSPVGGKLTFEQQVGDTPEEVLLHYRNTLEEAGFQVQVESKSEDPRAPGIVKAQKASPRQALQITVTPTAGQSPGSRLLFSVDAATAAK